MQGPKSLPKRELRAAQDEAYRKRNLPAGPVRVAVEAGEQQGDRAAAHADADVEEAPLEANVSRVATDARSGANRRLVRVRVAAVT